MAAKKRGGKDPLKAAAARAEKKAAKRLAEVQHATAPRGPAPPKPPPGIPAGSTFESDVKAALKKELGDDVDVDVRLGGGVDEHVRRAGDGARTRQQDLTGRELRVDAVQHELVVTKRHKFEGQHFRATLSEDDVQAVKGADKESDRKRVVAKKLRPRPRIDEFPEGSWSRDRDSIVTKVLTGDFGPGAA